MKFFPLVSRRVFLRINPKPSRAAFFTGLSCFARLLIVLGAFAANTSDAVTPRERILFDSSWRFRLGDPPDVTTNVTVYTELVDLVKLRVDETNREIQLIASRPDPVATGAGENVSFVQTNYNDSAWRRLDLPHDWVTELGFTSSGDQSHGYKDKSGTNNIGWYRRTFTLPADYTGKTLSLEFDGAYRNALIWLNGQCIGRNVSGYAPNYFDVTPYAISGGTNVLVVRVDTTRNEGWFYEGGGIYRHVWLVKSEPLHVAQWGTFVATTSLVGSNATLTVQTEVTNQSALAVSGTLTSTILDANSNTVTAITSAMNLGAGQGSTVTQMVAMANSRLWSLESPYLYKMVSTISNQSTLADVYETPFGVRTVSFDPDLGVFLNGQRVEIKGMCNHQDHAGVGSGLPDRLQYFRIERLKDMGVNAYRSSHNAPTAELIEACDRLGMLVMDETRRVGYDPETLGQLERMIRRDRNHPSIFVWSLANEEWNVQGHAVGFKVMQAMQNLAHKLDPTRRCTAAINGSWGGAGFSQVVDVQGFNYNLSSLESYHSSHPGTNIIGTEVASTVTTRGIYSNDTVRGYVASYDIITLSGVPNPVSWGETAEVWWPFYHARPWSSGGFVWTGFDYRGEPTPYNWPCINSHFGIMDMCGFPKDIFYYYQANWSFKSVLHVFPHWNWAGREGQPINVWAFGNCDSVELFLNGASQGQKSLNVLGHVEWNVPYTAGTLRAIGYRNGQPVLTNTVETTGTPAGIRLVPDRRTILADGRDLSMVTVSVIDAQGRVVPTATNLINFSITGGAIIGVGNGDPSSHEADRASQRAVFNGLAQVIVQSTNQIGSITLTATSSGLTSTNVIITAATTLPVPGAPAGVTTMHGDARVAVGWDVLHGAFGYNVKRATVSGGPYTSIATSIGTLGFTDTSVTNLTTYYYVVTAINDTGEGADSTQVSATPQPSPPDAPTGLNAASGDAQVSLSWTASTGATSYNVKRSTSSGGSYFTVTNVTTTSVIVTGLTNGTKYYFVVSATNTLGESANSVEASAIPFVDGPLPSPWLKQDVGSVGVTGGAGYNGGTYTVAGSGDDVWNNADAFRFVYVYVPISTNCDIRARVVSLENTHNNAKAGVMIRESLNADSRHALVNVTPGVGIEFIRRTNTAGSSLSSAASGFTAPYWVRLARTNNSFRAYRSANGSTWNTIGSAVTINMPTNAYVGLAVNSHDSGVLNMAVFDNVSISSLPANTAPVLDLISNRTVNVGQTVALTAGVTDAQSPPQTLTFSLLNWPSTATLNTNSGAFSWRPWVTDANSVNPITLKVADNGTPGLSATQSFTVTVNPLTLPSVASATLNGGQIQFQVSGDTGPDYAVQVSSNLFDWSTLLITNSPAMPWTWTDTNTPTLPVQFYRVKTGPPLP